MKIFFNNLLKSKSLVSTYSGTIRLVSETLYYCTAVFNGIIVRFKTDRECCDTKFH